MQWLVLAVGLFTGGLMSLFAHRRVLALSLYAAAALAVTFAWASLPLRLLWLALTLVGAGGATLWEIRRRESHAALVESLRSREEVGRMLEMLLVLTVSFGGPPPGKPRQDLWPSTSQWIDSTRDLLRGIGGARFVDIFNTTAGVPVEDFDASPNVSQEKKFLEMVSKHLHQLRLLIHEVEAWR